MKKKIMGVVLVVAVIGQMLVGCGENTTDSNGGNASGTDTEKKDVTVSQETVEDSGYVFVFQNVSLTPDAAAAELIQQLGEPNNYYEAPSCAFEGMDKIYDYGSVEIDTYEMEGVDYISSITLKDDMVETPEGVGLFMTMADMTNAYGEDYVEEQGMYVYPKGDMKLQFIIENDEITSSAYASTVLDAQ